MTRSEQLRKSDTVVQMNISTLFQIFSEAFNHGVNEGPFPQHGNLDTFHKLIEGEEAYPDGPYIPSLKKTITIVE
jgi:hypothetical protein